MWTQDPGPWVGADVLALSVWIPLKELVLLLLAMIYLL